MPIEVRDRPKPRRERGHGGKDDLGPAVEPHG